MIKTISALALITSASAFAIAPPDEDPKTFKYCLRTHKLKDGSKVASCDASHANKQDDVKLAKNGCAADQVALEVSGSEANIESCLPAGVVQL